MDELDVVIIDACRTAVGAFGGTLSTIPATQMGAIIIKSMLERNQIAPEYIDEVIIGQVLTAGCGQNPARQAAIAAGLPKEVSALTINQVCGSGLKSLQLAYQAIKNGDAELIIAGGQENMSLAPHLVPHSRSGVKMGSWTLEDSMIKDGLWDAFNNYHMGQTAENIAEKYEISREEQDKFAYLSQMKAVKAQQTHGFASEIIPVEILRKNHDPLIFNEDEFPRAETTEEGLSKLRPCFKKDGSVTAGNASGVNDGAAMVILASAQKARELGLAPMAKVTGFATAGVDPKIMGTGPIQASRKVLNKVQWSIDELDLIESNEAFAAQAIAVNREIGWDTKKVNVNGGAIALGHPIGASGTRIFVSLLHEMMRRKSKKGLATLCIGGGMGIAATIEVL
ncbi:TPA: acetyl-CoA C-acetyltransferase [Raoultella planticola]|nr:acetyl-CoA C-acetyltransferase [Raoultella planticola]